MGRYCTTVCILFCILLKVKAEERLQWFSSKTNINLIAPNYLPESKKENRRLAVVMEGDYKELEIECIMSGFEGDKSSQPKWTTDFEDWQIGNKGTEPVIENEYARWKIYVNVTNTDAGTKRISCNYQQGYFAKVIEIEFDIYNNVKPVNADDLQCQRKGVKNECAGKIEISYEQSNSNPIPYDKITEDVKKQINNIYQTNEISEAENIFTVSIDFKSDLKNLKGKKWIRDGVEVDDINNLSQLCDCVSVTDATSTTTKSPQTTSTTQSESSTTVQECSEDDIQCRNPIPTKFPQTTSPTHNESTAEKECGEDAIQCIYPITQIIPSTTQHSTTSTRRPATTKNPFDICMNDGQCRDQSCILDNIIYNLLNDYYAKGEIYWKPKRASVFDDAKTLSDARRGMLGTKEPNWKNLLMPLRLNYDSNDLPKNFMRNASLIKNKNWCGSSWAWTTNSVLKDRMLVYNKTHNHMKWPKKSYCFQQTASVEEAWKIFRQIGECEPAYRVGHWNELRKDMDKILKENMYDIMWEIRNHGPVEAVMKVYSDLFLYGSGVYHHTNDHLVGHHAVKIVGWGEEDGANLKYWIVANNWGQSWGEDGFFRIIRGENQSNIERYVIGAKPSQKSLKALST